MNLTIPKYSAINFNKYKNFKPQQEHKQIKSQNSSSLAFYGLREFRNIYLHRVSEQNFFESFLQKPGKVTPEEYEDIAKNHPSVILKAQKYCKHYYCGSTTYKDLAHIGILAAKYLDDNFKNYRIISIGTSPSPITEQLKNMGHDVVFLPASGLRLFESRRRKRRKPQDYEKVKVLMEYLKMHKIDDGKLNIILDYTVSKSSLNVVANFIKDYFGFSDEDIKKISLNDTIIQQFGTIAEERYKKDLLFGVVEEISNIPHCPVVCRLEKYYSSKGEETTVFIEKHKTPQELNDSFERYSQPLARAFSLCTMAELDKMRKRMLDDKQNQACPDPRIYEK